ncbi:MAG TPA: rhomboid-like protein [Marmoricola sp.]|nr:rhomboid-like protein [Marmoricola sp.]
MTASTPAAGLRDSGWHLSPLRRVTSAPFTYGYLAVLLATTLLLRNVSSEVADRLLTGSSTDVAHLTHEPIRVLVASALWLPGRWWLPYALLFLLVLAPLERRFGVRRAALVFLSGHVLATLLTELPIGAAIAMHLLAPAEAHRLDVGVSYGTYAAVAAFAGSLRRRRAMLVLGAAVVSIVVPEAADPDMTMWGHLISLGIGLCWWPFLYRRRTIA